MKKGDSGDMVLRNKLRNKLRITGTPTKIVNGDINVGSSPDSTLESYLKK